MGPIGWKKEQVLSRQELRRLMEVTQNDCPTRLTPYEELEGALGDADEIEERAMRDYEAGMALSRSLRSGSPAMADRIANEAAAHLAGECRRAGIIRSVAQSDFDDWRIQFGSAPRLSVHR